MLEDPKLFFWIMALRLKQAIDDFRITIFRIQTRNIA